MADNILNPVETSIMYFVILPVPQAPYQRVVMARLKTDRKDYTVSKLLRKHHVNLYQLFVFPQNYTDICFHQTRKLTKNVLQIAVHFCLVIFLSHLQQLSLVFHLMFTGCSCAHTCMDNFTHKHDFYCLLSDQTYDYCNDNIVRHIFQLVQDGYRPRVTPEISYKGRWE